MLKKLPILFLLLWTHFSFAQAPQDTQSLININVGVELAKLETSAVKMEQSIQLASQALQEIAENPNLNKQQQAKVVETFNQIDKLASTLQVSIKEIPSAITKSTPPILTAVDNLFSNIQLTIIIILIVIVLILLFALIAIYYWVIKPTTTMVLKTTSKIDNMATALQTTATIVEKTTEQQLIILNHYPVSKESE